ncbi:MAG: DUF4173 domain-containing protein [Bacteroidota bacterium]
MQTITIPKPATIINSAAKFIFIVVGAVLFNLLFWEEKMALNAALFFLYAVGGILYFYPGVFASKKVRWLLLASVISLSMVVFHNTLLSQISLAVSVLLLAAYSQYLHNSILYAGASILQSFLFFVPAFISSLQQVFFLKKRKPGVGKMIRLAIFPLLIAGIFLIVYLMANKVFADVLETAALKIEWFVNHLVRWVEPQRLLFLLLGLLISGGLLVRHIKAPLETVELRKSDDLQRVRRKRKGSSITADLRQFFLGKLATGTNALKNEYKAGLLCLVLLNGLLLMVNATDVLYVWFGFSYKPDINWPTFVHEGAGLLVLSILLAMLLVLFFFRGNLNFFSKNRWLRALAYVWIAQNAVLAISVCIRNMYYIQHMGLAYKRVGLFVYVLLVLIGLITIVIKIQKRKTAYYLWRVNALAAFVILLVSSCIDWDVAIARYNISKKDSIQSDIWFLVRMNDHVLPLLQQNKAWICSLVPTAISKDINRDTRFPPDKCEMIDVRIKAFLENEKSYSWLSWNWADENARKQLQTTIR